jgi:outer membrane lipoprotein SlyB
MNTSIHTLPASAAHTKPLWAAVGVLGVAVVALGASLVYVQSRPVDGHAALAAIYSQAPALVAPAATVSPAEALGTREDLVAAPPVAVVRPAATRTAPKMAHVPAAPAPAPVAAAAPAPAAGPAPAAPVAAGTSGAGNLPDAGAPSVVTDTAVIASHPVPVVQHPVCANCGTIESVTPIQRNAKSGSGVGVVAGGALGAVLGNQIGKGGGRAVATILGAVGGGLAGNAIEKNMKKETVYQVQVRMQDGSLRTVEQGNPATVGARVTISGGVLHSADQSAWAPAPARPKPVPRLQQQQPQDNNRA